MPTPKWLMDVKLSYKMRSGASKFSIISPDVNVILSNVDMLMSSSGVKSIKIRRIE